MVKKTCRRREPWGIEILKWKIGMKDDFSCVSFQRDTKWENDSQFGKWDLIFFWVQKHLVILFVVSIFKAMCPRNWEGSMMTWDPPKDPKCLSSVFQFGLWAHMLNCCDSLLGSLMGRESPIKIHASLAKDRSSNFNCHKSFYRQVGQDPTMKEENELLGWLQSTDFSTFVPGKTKCLFFFLNGHIFSSAVSQETSCKMNKTTGHFSGFGDTTDPAKARK